MFIKIEWNEREAKAIERAAAAIDKISGDRREKEEVTERVTSEFINANWGTVKYNSKFNSINIRVKTEFIAATCQLMVPLAGMLKGMVDTIRSIISMSEEFGKDWFVVKDRSIEYERTTKQEGTNPSCERCCKR